MSSLRNDVKHLQKLTAKVVKQLEVLENKTATRGKKRRNTKVFEQVVMNLLLKAASEYFDVSIDFLRSRNGKGPKKDVKKMIAAVATIEGNFTNVSVLKGLNLANHTSIMNLVKKHTDFMDVDPEYRNTYTEFTNYLTQNL